jgi:hypothetical protein
VARNRSTTCQSRSVIVAIPAHVPPKKPFVTTIPGRRNSMYEPAPPRSDGTREKSWP